MMNKAKRNARNLINAWRKKFWHRPAFVQGNKDRLSAC
jgi:hypothetical protein